MDANVPRGASHAESSWRSRADNTTTARLSRGPEDACRPRPLYKL